MMSSNPHVFSTIIHIGAGKANELDSWLDSGVESVVLVEPHPRLAEKLRKRTEAMPKVTVVEAALSSDVNLIQLYEYNLPGLDSLRLPSGLKQIFPGLKISKSYPVETESLTQLLEQYLPKQEQATHLIIEATGEETALIAELIASDKLDSITSISLVAGIESLYEGTQPAAVLLEQLKVKGYELRSEVTLNPEWGRWELHRNPLADEITYLKQELEQNKADLLEEVKASQQVSERLKAEVKQLNSLLEKQAKEFQNSLEAKKTELAKRKEGYKATRKSYKAELEQAHAALAKEKSLSLKTVDKLKIEVQQLVAQQEKLTEDFQARLASKESELSTQGATHQEVLKAHVTELEQVKAALAKEKASYQQMADKLTTELEGLTSSLEEQAQEFKEAQKSSAKEHAMELEAIKEELQKNKEWFSSRKKQALELEEALEVEKAKTQSLTQENELLKKSLETSNAGFQLLNERLEKLFSDQSAQIQQSTNALGKHVTQSFVDQRQHYQSVLSLQYYLESGETPLQFGGWAIDSGVASHLVRILRQNNYDLIIEFGSGTSTALMAKVIAQQLANNKEYADYTQLDYEASAQPTSQTKSGQAIKAVKSGASFEVPRRILSFEQDKQYYQLTKQTLISQGLDGLVELVLAPLVPTAYIERTKGPLFYDCDKQLAQVAQLYGNRTAKILILVDGPYSPKADPLVREPALAHLLQHLSAHHLDIILDDSKRQGEQQVAEQWRNLCEERGLPYNEKALETEKGALWITVTP